MDEKPTSPPGQHHKKHEQDQAQVVPVSSERLDEIGHELHQIQHIIARFDSKFTGPLPPAAEFAKYNQGVSDAAERILAMAEREQAHTHEMERQALELSRSSAIEARRIVGRGQLIALAIGLAALSVAVIGSIDIGIHMPYILSYGTDTIHLGLRHGREVRRPLGRDPLAERPGLRQVRIGEQRGQIAASALLALPQLPPDVQRDRRHADGGNPPAAAEVVRRDLPDRHKFQRYLQHGGQAPDWRRLQDGVVSHAPYPGDA